MNTFPLLFWTFCTVLSANTQVSGDPWGAANMIRINAQGSTKGQYSGTQNQDTKPPMKWGSLEINPHVITSSLTPMGLNVGIFILPYIEAEASARTGSSGSAAAGKIAGNFVSLHLGKTPVVPYASFGYGLASINELDDDTVGFSTFGVGLKIFLKRFLAIRAELGHTNYEGSVGSDTAVSFGMSLVPF